MPTYPGNDPNAGISFGETSTKLYYDIFQRAFSGEFDQFNPNWANDGYCVDTPEYDLTTVSVPVAAQYITGD